MLKLSDGICCYVILMLTWCNGDTIYFLFFHYYCEDFVFHVLTIELFINLLPMDISTMMVLLHRSVLMLQMLISMLLLSSLCFLGEREVNLRRFWSHL